MIKINVDEAAAYDMLAIQSIKNEHNGRLSMMEIEEHTVFSYQIGREVGQELHVVILASSEYEALRLANQRVFEAVDIVKLPYTFDARWIDGLNYQRYVAKQALQKRWFPDKPLTERKLGYDGGMKAVQ